MHIGALQQSGLRSPDRTGTVHPQLNLDDAVEGVMLGPPREKSRRVFLQEVGLLHMVPGGTTSCMAHWLKMSGRGQRGRARREGSTPKAHKHYYGTLKPEDS